MKFYYFCVNNILSVPFYNNHNIYKHNHTNYEVCDNYDYYHLTIRALVYIPMKRLRSELVVNTKK